MLLRPTTCCRQRQSAPVNLSPYSISFISLYLKIRTYTTPPSYESKPKTSSPRILPASVGLNPPTTTHPPPLSLPQRLPDLPTYKYYFRVGKAYGVFYKKGLTAIWTNYKLARSLPNQIFSSGQAKIHQAVLDGVLSRADFQLIRRTRLDINKLPPFALIWLICGEFTPLVVIFFTGAVPRTIWIPKQVQQARERTENRRAKSTDPSIGLFAGPSWQSDLNSMPTEAQRRLLKSYAQSLGLYPVWWDRWIPTLIPTSLVRRRVFRRLRELKVDDFAIERDGGVEMLEAEEVRMACEERGIDILGKDEMNLRVDLKRWMKRKRNGCIQED